MLGVELKRLEIQIMPDSRLGHFRAKVVSTYGVLLARKNSFPGGMLAAGNKCHEIVVNTE